MEEQNTDSEFEFILPEPLTINKEEEVEIIFDVVESIINDAKGEVETKLNNSVTLIESMEEGVERNKKIISEIDSLYLSALATFENAKSDIKNAWRQVKLSGHYTLYLGYDKKIKNVKAMLNRVNRIKQDVLDVNGQYNCERKKYEDELKNFEASEKARLSIDYKLGEQKKQLEKLTKIKSV